MVPGMPQTKTEQTSPSGTELADAVSACLALLHAVSVRFGDAGPQYRQAEKVWLDVRDLEEMLTEPKSDG